MPTLAQAEQKAIEIMNSLMSQVSRIEIAGSVLRGKPNPKDLEIVCIPRMQQDLFGNNVPLPVEVNHLGNVIKNGQRYKQIELPEGYNLDLFIVTPPAQWGYIFALRTGPDTFSKKVVTKKCYGGLLPSYAKCRDGAVWSEGELIEMPEERDLFKFLGIDWIPPKDRQ